MLKRFGLVCSVSRQSWKLYEML